MRWEGDFFHEDKLALRDRAREVELDGVLADIQYLAYQLDVPVLYLHLDGRPLLDILGGRAEGIDCKVLATFKKKKEPRRLVSTSLPFSFRHKEKNETKKKKRKRKKTHGTGGFGEISTRSMVRISPSTSSLQWYSVLFPGTGGPCGGGGA